MRILCVIDGGSEYRSLRKRYRWTQEYVPTVGNGDFNVRLFELFGRVLDNFELGPVFRV